jgi:oxaloacetate decarboxylase gamma subunit
MTIFDMLEQSGVLTLLGMGIVFSFLVLMIIAVTIVGKIIHALGMDKEAEVKSGSTTAGLTSGQSGEVTAAISAAVNEYRKK